MRLLCYIDSLGSGGAQRQMLEIAKHMIEKGHSVGIVWYADNDFYSSFFEECGAQCFYKKVSSILERFELLKKSIQQYKPDSVLCFMYSQAIVGSLLKIITLGKWRLIISMRSNNEAIFLSPKRKVSRLLYCSVNEIVCNSYSEAMTWEKHCKYLSNRVNVIPNYVLLNVVNNSVRRNKCRRIIITANLCSMIKNPMNVARALCLLNKEERENIVIEWYGRRYIGNQLSPVCIDVEKFIMDNGISDVFITHDETYNIHEIMSEFDIVALFSREEGLPNAICEGMKLGKPIVMTKVSDWEKLIQGNGIVCNGTDAESIAEALRKIISMPDKELERMGLVSKMLANKLFDEKQITEQWESVLFAETTARRKTYDRIG